MSCRREKVTVTIKKVSINKQKFYNFHDRVKFAPKTCQNKKMAG